MIQKYVGDFSATLRKDNGDRLATLLWGDTVHLDDDWQSNGGQLVHVSARDHQGWLDRDVLSDQSLLEIYVIDVGQGDSILFKTLDGKWHLVDAGAASRDQMTRKGAANFLRWKFIDDLKLDKIKLENVILSHPDSDHYGGFIDLFSGRLLKNDKTFEIEVNNFYHNGLARYKNSPKLGAVIQGKVSSLPFNHGLSKQGSFIIELLDDQDTFANPHREFNSSFAEYASLVGQYPHNVRRISQLDRFLPGYDHGDVIIRVLGPIAECLENGQIGLRVFQSESKTRNGHSVIIRLDYGQARFLLTGDLNDRSQRLLLSYFAENEFLADVAKGCHHGSEDIALEFIRAMNARVSVISSGDNEDYSHPRPLVIGASSRYGRESVGVNGEKLPPLVYSTELARSVNMAYTASLQVNTGINDTVQISTFKPEKARVKPDIPKVGYLPLNVLPLATNLVYGLVNIRSDGNYILCATMKEKNNDFDIKILKAGDEA